MKIDSIYKHFLITKASHLPLVDEEGRLLGLVSKNRLQQELAELSEERKEFDSIPLDFLDKSLNENILNYFRDNSRIPVLSTKGERVDFWDKPRFLAEFSKLEPRPKKDPKLEEIAVKKEKAAETKDPVHWFMELILANFPDGLFATEVTGSTVFYNEAFERDFLKHGIFRDSLATAEKLFQEKNKDLIANYLQENNLDLQDKSGHKVVLQTVWKEAHAVLRIISLEKEGKIAGFLYQLTKLADKNKSQDKNSGEFTRLDLAFQDSIPLLPLLSQVEGQYIKAALQKNKSNISHTAKALGIPRTTLQNRIRFLNISLAEQGATEKMVIPRKKKSTQMPLVPKKGKASSNSSKAVSKPLRKSSNKTTKPPSKAPLPKGKPTPPAKKIKKRR